MGTEGVLSRELWPRQAPPKFGGEQDENMPPTPRSAAPKPSPRNNNNSNSQQQQPVKTPLRTGSFCFQANAGEHATPGRTTPRRTPLRPRQANTASAAPSPSPSLRISAKTPFRGAADAASTPGRRAGGPVTRPASVSDSQVLDSESDTVKVCIRVRPLNTREMEFGGGHKCTEVRGTRHLVLQAHPEPQVYTFDHVAAENSTQEELFSVAGRPIVSNCMDGYNSCIFAYGQTGSGKTHTMLGCLPESAEERCDPEAGLIVRVFRNLFESISRQEKDKGRDSTKYICKCSMIEIYNEVIYDLLNPMQTQCHIREDIKAGVHMVGQTEEDVYSVIDVVRLLQHGTANRHVGQTKMNRESSRSHCVFSCVIESKVTQDGITNIRHSRLNLVDLAGSERQKSTGAAGDRLREASNINKSLSVLGHVIMSLVEVQHGKQRHIPYRDSRLTFLLQDSLGGNSKTVMIANVSPATSNYGETLSTLRFAQRAKHIRNKAVVNENTTGDSALLRKEIQRLKAELANYQARPQNDVASFMTSPLVGRSSSGAFQMSPLLFGGSPDFGGKSTPENVKTSSDRAALKGALRREASAVEDLGKCKEQLREMSNLLSLKDKDHQRFNMIIRLREGKIKRLEESEAGNVPEEVRLLQQELSLWKEKAEHHPEVTRYAMDNLQLKESLAEMRKFTGGERETLLDEVAVLRAKTLELLESEKEMEDVETVAARVAAASAAQIEQAAAHHEQVSAALGVQLEAARGQAEGARAEMDRLREEVWQLRSTLEDKSVELLDAKVAADEAAQSHARIVSGLENELKSEQEANGTLTQEVAALQRALEALRSESNARLEAASAEATASLDELRSQLSQVHFELEDKAMLEASLSHAEHCANAIQAELDSVLQEIEFQRCEAESRMAEAEAAEKRAGEAESEANAMVERLARLAGVGNDGAANLVAAGDALARVEDRVRQLGEALEVSQQEADMLRAQLDTMVSAEEVESLQNRLDEQEDIVSQICEEVAEYQQELDFLRAESERQHAASNAHAARAAALEGAAAEAAEFKALNDQLSGHMDELVTAMEERNASNTRLREKLAALPDLNEVEALREGLSRAEERAAQLSREVEVATSVADNLRSREAEAADEANRLTNDLAAAKLREEELEELVAALEDENPSATPARGRGEGQLRQRLDHLERELGREQAANEEAHSMLQVKSQQLNQMQDELAAKQSAPDVASAVEWEAEREALRLEIEQQRAAVDEATGELSGMVEVNLQLQEEVAGLKRRAEAAEARESKLESELTKLAGQHNVAQRIHHMQKVKEENALLRAEVVQVREELRRVQHRCQLLLEPQGNHSSVAGGNGRPASTDRRRPGNGSRRTPIVWQPPAVTSSSAEEALGSAEE